MGPYDIQQVDIGGAINAYRVGQQDRIAQIKAKQEMAALERQQKAREAIARRMGGGGAATDVVDAYKPKGGDPASGQAAAPVSASAPAAAPQFLGASSRPGIYDRNAQQALLGELATIDVPTALEMATQFSQLNKADADNIKQVYGYVGNAALHLRSLPPQDRAAELARITPDLVARGVPADKIAGFDLSDRSLEYLANQTRDVEAIIDQTAPKVMPLQPGGEIGRYTPASPFPAFDQGAPVMTREQAEPIIAASQESGVISEQDAAAFVRAVGRQAFDTWAKKYGVTVGGGPISKTVNGRTYYQVGGKWFDNPEGR